MWEIYDELIGKIDEKIKIEEYYMGEIWTYVKTKDNVGIAMTIADDTAPQIRKKDFENLTLKEGASLVKSWNFKEATFGMACINAWYNKAKENINVGEKSTDRDAFITYQEKVKGKNVGVIGHFPFLEKRFAPICNMKIFERKPQAGDYPDMAIEEYLEEMDYVFVTGATLTNKTFPRIFKLAQNGKIILVGPSAPMSEDLLKLGVMAIESFVVTDFNKCKDFIINDSTCFIFPCGKMTTMAIDNL